MSNEEFERQMTFILEQQARVSANLEKLQERDAHWEERHAQSEKRHAQGEKRHAQWEARMDKVDRQIEQLVASLSILRDAIIGLTHHVEGHEDHLERHNQEMAAIRRANAERVELGKEMDARLNALMLVVERHISGHQ